MRIPALLPLLLLAACGGLSATSEDVLFPNGGNDGDDDDAEVLDDDDDRERPGDDDDDVITQAPGDDDDDVPTQPGDDDDDTTFVATDTGTPPGTTPGTTTTTTTDTGTPPATTPPTGPPCTNTPNVSLTAVGPSGAGSIDPRYMTVEFWGNIESGDIVDFKWYDDTSTSWVSSSAIISVSFFDTNGAFLCDTWYDGSNATQQSGGWAAGMWEAWNLNLANGDTACPELDANYWKLSDPRNLIEIFDWGVGLGALTGQHATDLEQAVGSSGGDWANDYAPYAYGTFVTYDGAASEDHGYGFEFERTCSEITDEQGLLSINTTPNGNNMEEYYQTYGFYFSPPLW